MINFKRVEAASGAYQGPLPVWFALQVEDGGIGYAVGLVALRDVVAELLEEGTLPPVAHDRLRHVLEGQILPHEQSED